MISASRIPLPGPKTCAPTRPVPRYDWPLVGSLTLCVPVVQAGLGTCDGPRLAAAVSRAGALGTMTVFPSAPDTYRRRLARIRRITSRPVLLSFNTEWEPEEMLLTSLDAGFRHFQVFWWNGLRLARRIHDAGGLVFWQVGTADQARDALDAGADVLIAQGTDAGGQVRSPHPVHELISLIRTLPDASTIPLVAGGGLANHSDVRAVLDAGANAALLGTRFLLSQESTAPHRDKQCLLHASPDSLILDPRLVGDWPCAPRRRVALTNSDDRSSLFAGMGLGRMRGVKSAREIVRELF